MFDIINNDAEEIKNSKVDKTIESARITKPVIFLEEELNKVNLPTITGFNFAAFGDANLALATMVGKLDTNSLFCKNVGLDINHSQCDTLFHIINNAIKEHVVLSFNNFIISKCKHLKLADHVALGIIYRFDNKISPDKSSSALKQIIVDFINDTTIFHKHSRDINYEVIDKLYNGTYSGENPYTDEYELLITSYSYTMTNLIGTMMTSAIHEELSSTFFSNYFDDGDEKAIDSNELLSKYKEIYPDSIKSLAVLYFENCFTAELYDLMITNIEPSIKGSLSDALSTLYMVFDDSKLDCRKAIMDKLSLQSKNQ